MAGNNLGSKGIFSLRDLSSAIATQVTSQSRFGKFQRMYRNDRIAFAYDVMTNLGKSMTPYQEEILGYYDDGYKRVAVRGPHGLGKTFLASILVHHGVLTSEMDAKIITTASAWRQLEKYLWTEIRKLAKSINWETVGREPYDQNKEFFQLSIRLAEGTVEAFAVASDDHNTIEGAHASRLMYIFDEAKSIPRDTWNAAEGAFSNANVFRSSSIPNGLEITRDVSKGLEVITDRAEEEKRLEPANGRRMFAGTLSGVRELITGNKAGIRSDAMVGSGNKGDKMGIDVSGWSDDKDGYAGNVSRSIQPDDSVSVSDDTGSLQVDDSSGDNMGDGTTSSDQSTDSNDQLSLSNDQSSDQLELSSDNNTSSSRADASRLGSHELIASDDSDVPDDELSLYNLSPNHVDVNLSSAGKLPKNNSTPHGEIVRSADLKSGDAITSPNTKGDKIIQASSAINLSEGYQQASPNLSREGSLSSPISSDKTGDNKASQASPLILPTITRYYAGEHAFAKHHFDLPPDVQTSHPSEALALAISTPGEPSGQFYDIHMRKPGYEDWVVRHVTLDEAINAGRISAEWAHQRERQWGRTSSIYQNRVLGEFADESEEGIIPLTWINEAVDRWRDWDRKGRRLDPGRRTIGVDVARSGTDKTVLCFRHALTVEVIRVISKTSLTSLANIITSSYEGRHINIEMDGGLGAGLYDILHSNNTPNLHPITVNSPTPFRDRSKEMLFLNIRSAMWWNLREMLDPEYGSAVCLPPVDLLIADLSTPKWFINRTLRSNPVVQLEDKDSIRDRIGRSTDYGDACCLSFWLAHSGGGMMF